MEIASVFKKYKKLLFFTLGGVIAVLTVVYALFLFAVPNLINLNNYKTDIQKIFADNAKLNLDFEDAKIVTTPALKAGVNVKGVTVSYPDGGKILTAKESEIKIKLLPLLFKTVQVSDVFVDTPSLNLTLLKDGQLDIISYINKNLLKEVPSHDTAVEELPVKISDKLPLVQVEDYSLTLKDAKSGYSAVLKGNSFVLDKAVLNKHFRITTNGKILFNNKENVHFNARVMSFFPVISTSEEAQTQEMPKIDIFKELVKYDPKADIDADLNIKEHDGHTDINGFIHADKISVKLDGIKLPDSYFHMTSKGHKTNVESDIFISPDEKAEIFADISHGRKTKLDINVKTYRISFFSIKNFASALMNSLNMQNDLASINTRGAIKADFTVKTDLKKFESSGYLNIADGFVSHKSIPVLINGINADVDFSNNNINIKKASALINGTKICAKGFVDSKSNADISINSGDINIAPLFNAFAPLDLKNSYILKSGVVGVDVTLKGRLDNLTPVLDAGLEHLLVKTKSPMPLVTVSLPEAKIKADTKDIKIVPFTILVNSSKINVLGGIQNYLNNMEINIIADGSIVSNDLKNLLPKEIRAYAGAKGSVPFKAQVTGNDKKAEISAQAYTNADSYFSPVVVKKMAGKPGLINFNAVYSKDKLAIDDASLYQSSKTSYSKDFASNKKGSQKIAGVTGGITNLASSHPIMKVNFSIPETLVLSTFSMPTAQLKARGDINISGDINNPNSLSYKGFFTVKDVTVPDFLLKIQDADIELNDNAITAKVQNLDINGTALNIDAEASSKFMNIFLIKTMKVTSTNFDADKLFAAMDKINSQIPASQSAQTSGSSSSSLMLPVKISDGDLNIQKFKMKQAGGNLDASDISGDFSLINDLFKLDNLKASAFGGNISGNVTYNVKTTAVTAKIKGEKIDANPAVTVFAGLKDQMMGKVDFDADVKLKGATYIQQMKSLNGKVHFALKDGQMGSLGRFETFLKADNLLSQSFVSTKIGSLISSVAPYNTGKFAYLNGDINIKNGAAYLAPVKMSGPHMSLLLTGNLNILSMISSLEILGSLSPDVVNSLGPVGDLSVEKFAAYIPKFGTKIASALNNYNASANKAELAKIPALTPSKTGTKSFKVVLNGNLNNPPSAVKRFQWLNTPEKIKEEQAALEEAVTPKLPATKEEFKEMVKEDLKQGVTNALQKNEKVQQIQQNKAVKTFSEIYKLYKQSDTKTQPTGTAE